MKNVCFTGHRILKITDELKEELKKQLDILISNGAVNFFSGGAFGWDMLCQKAVIELKEKYPHIKLNLILPCPSSEQTLKWNDQDKKEYHQQLQQADNIIVLSDNYYNGCMKKRNSFLIENADCCLCYYNPCHYKSGTGQTVRMALKKNIPVINLYSPMSVCEIQ